ncbi:hypothetical protein HU200_060485 [Digitaria exilis]|uniref:PROP1-like PPR domain-containing protein n=1 Tax=Digitaria exilis TaxID=1010633 RepID=A0A835E294_9POAL|nr:hypothetical protein HU200_060485 [Digitaria exilis]
MLLRRWPKCTAEWLSHKKLLPWKVYSHPFSIFATSVQLDDSSSDEKLNCAPDNEPIRKRPQSLSSDSIVQTLRCLKRKPAVAFAYFKDTHSLGFHHDFSTYSEIIQILSHSFQGKMLVSLFCEMISTPNSASPEILTLIDHLRNTCVTSHVLSFAVNCLIKAYTTCHAHDAQATIEKFCHLCRLGFVPTVWACNFLLKFVSQRGESDLVVIAYDQMKSFQLTLDAQSLNIVTRSLFQANKADEAFQVWVGMIEMGVKPDVHGYSSFIIGLCDCGKFDLAYNMVSRYTVLQENTHERGYSYLVRSYCELGNLKKAWHHVEAMVSHGIEINCHIVGYLLQCLRKLGMTSEVIVHFQKFRDLGLHFDGVVYNIGMDAYCKLGNMNEAVMLLKQMMAEGLAPDKIHYTCLINGYCLKGETENAWQAFEQMLKANIKPDVVTYNILASGYSRNGLVMKVFDLLEHMVDQGLEPNSLTYGVVIAGFCRVGNLSEAEVLFNIVEEKGIENIEVMYSSMISNLCREGKVEGASTVCMMMLEKNVVPDVISYSKLISAYCQTGDTRSAQLWFDDMVERGFSDVIAYTVLMNGYCKVGQIKKACELFHQMINFGMKPDVVAYTVLLDGHLKEILRRGWQGIAKEGRGRSFLLRAKQKYLLSSMKDNEIEPDVAYYTVLIDGQCKAEYLDEARRLFDEMLAKGLAPDVYTYTALINGYCSQGEASKAEDLLQEMIDKGMKPDELTFSVLHQRTLRD